ncbi:MAG: sialate O-acetylesterase [Planctomycetota bacterium]|nr:sialate O-acetylesterase [Planctomycetota bacterium]
MMKQVFKLSSCAFVLLATTLQAQGLKVYILAGQSNMEGHAKIETFDYIGDDPATAPMLKEMRGSNGQPRVCGDVWISYLTGGRSGNGEGLGKLTAGYGSRRKPAESGGKIGPEFTFGLYMDKVTEEPILIIKTAWGGKSLHTDFRPPSAGPYQPTKDDIKRKKFETAEQKAALEKATGHYYRLMVAHVQHVLGDIKRVYPGYDAKKGYEIAGFVWFQGWNDLVNRSVYPEKKQKRFAKYTGWMADFIRDVRKDLSAPDMKFVIGVIGVNGTNPNEKMSALREAMVATSLQAEFKGNVAAVRTAPFWDDALAAIDKKRGQVRQVARQLKNGKGRFANQSGKMSAEQQRAYVDKFRADLIPPADAALFKRGASNAGYHYLGCAKTMGLIGKAYAEALLQMEGR